LTIFFHEANNQKQLMQEMQITNLTENVVQKNYSPSLYCRDHNVGCDISQYLYAEPFIIFLSLFANWTNHGGIMAKQQTLNVMQSAKDPVFIMHQEEKILVEKRDYFLADELVKFLILPYLDVPISKRLFYNANLVSTIYANALGYPGLFGKGIIVRRSSADYSYVAYPGIPSLAYYKPSEQNVVMPHAAFPLLLQSKSRNFGVAWYATMLNSTVSQTSVGQMDTIQMTGEI
jgi:hypothetical protein